MIEKIKLSTNDGAKITGDYYSADKAKKAILLLHMMPATKESWANFAEKLQKSGFNVLAIDLRGHGESTKYKIDDIGELQNMDFRKFSDKNHQASIHDVESAVEFLQSKGNSEINIAGASIGANLALWYASDHKEIKNIILLSAGLNYHGVETEQYSKALSSGQSVYFVADKGDNDTTLMAQKLFDMTLAKKEIKIFNEADHGTNILKTHKELEDELIRWLNK